MIVAINSPGGTTAGGEELYEALSALRAKKPVVAVISELGASAAYMTAIAADRIFARRLSIVGSIGVLFQHVDAGKLLDTIGVDFDKVQTGPLKAEPDIDEPMVGEVRASLQSLVDDSFPWFVDIVAERRGLTRPETLALADGRILTGRQALDRQADRRHRRRVRGHRLARNRQGDRQGSAGLQRLPAARPMAGSACRAGWGRGHGRRSVLVGPGRSRLTGWFRFGRLHHRV